MAVTHMSMKVNDLLPAIRVRLKWRQDDGTESLVNLSTAEEVRFIMRLPRASVPKVDRPVTVEDASGGIVRIDWAVGETDTIGCFNVEFEVTYPGGQPLTIPNRSDEPYLVMTFVPDLG